MDVHLCLRVKSQMTTIVLYNNELEIAYLYIQEYNFLSLITQLLFKLKQIIQNTTNKKTLF